MAKAYYNEIDPFAAQWLRNLIDAGLIAPGEVDERGIEDVLPNELTGYTQCHFFAGIGVWSYALRQAGWSDNRPVWTGSCPCQPFSQAGKGKGFADERHLWPAWYWLLEQCRPPIIVGEQVAGKSAGPWIDLVQSDLEALDYAFGCVPFPSAGVGAPHIRDRAYWVATEGVDNSSSSRRKRSQQKSKNETWDETRMRMPGEGCRVSRLADNEGERWPGELLRTERRLSESRAAKNGSSGRMGNPDGEPSQRRTRGISGAQTESSNKRHSNGRYDNRYSDAGEISGMAHPNSNGRSTRSESTPTAGYGHPPGTEGSNDRSGSTGPANSLWSAADWLYCRDGKWRPVEASPQPLADGSAESLGRVCPSIITQAEEAVNAAAVETKSEPTALLRNLLDALSAEAPRLWTVGGLPGLYEAPFLLAFLRQLTEQGWHFSKSCSLPRPKATQIEMRGLWDCRAITGAPHQRGLDGQSIGECADPVHILSSLLSRVAQEAWGNAHQAYAEVGFPLGHNAPARVGRLRAYGNAINAEVAKEFIKAYMSIC